MRHLVKKWFPEKDPIIEDQIDVLELMLGDSLTKKSLEGFLIICSRFVDDYGNHRIEELKRIFKTHKREGRRSLLLSLEHVCEWVGGMDTYLNKYPITIVPPVPTFPQFKIVEIDTIADKVYRVFSSDHTVYKSEELVRTYVERERRLPPVPVQTSPVLREKPVYHWCSYEKWDSPEDTREALQILPEWGNDCQLRATLLTSDVRNASYVAFNGDRNDPTDSRLRFYGYFFEPLAKDHPPLNGRGSQIGVEGAPAVSMLEAWDGKSRRWVEV